MRLQEILNEHVVNLLTPDEKKKYAELVWDMLQTSYAPRGGFNTSANVDELISKSGMWKLIVRNGVLTAVQIYRDQYGRKGIGIGSNGTRTGIQDVKQLLLGNSKTKRAWSEVSGAPEKLYTRLGAQPIPNKFAPFLSKHPIINYDEDGYHHTRLVHGVPRTKIMYGTAILSKEDQEALKAQGIDLTDLPPNIKLL